MMIATRAITALLVGTSVVALSQTATTLKQRGASAPQTAPAPTDYAKGYSTLPDQASGEYELDNNGSVVQITVEQNQLSGYVTKMDGGSALTLFFQHTRIQGSRVSFTTQIVHGLSYAFTGSVTRGDEESASKTGYYRLAGQWTAYHDGGHETRSVNLKSTPRLPHTND